MYWVTLSDISNERLLGFIAHSAPRWQRVLGRFALPLAKRYACWRLRVTRANVDAGVEQLKQVFEEVSATLADGRRFLVGERFSAADLTFASLSALVLLPANYGVPLFEPDELPAWARATVDELRATPAGRYGLRLYEEQRRSQ
jgi:glutathione S-transferase